MREATTNASTALYRAGYLPPTLDDLPRLSPADIGRRAASLARDQDRLDRDGRPGLSDEVAFLLVDVWKHQVERKPETIADAAALLLLVADGFHQAASSDEFRANLFKEWMLLGTVTKFLAGVAGIECAEIGSDYYCNSVDGPDERVAVGWWIDRLFLAGGTLLLSEHGEVDFFLPTRSSGQAKQARDLRAEMGELPRGMLKQQAAGLAVMGLEVNGASRPPISGHRWAVATIHNTENVKTVRVPGEREET